MTKLGSLLVVDDNKSILTSVKMLMEPYFDHIYTLSTPNGIASHMQRERLEVVLLDMNFHAGINNGNEGLYWLRYIKERQPDARVVLFTAYADINLAVTGIKEGAADFVVKPWDNDKMVEALTQGGGLRARRRDEQDSESAMYWGSSPAIEPLRRMVERTAHTDANILITGENGTGKEMLAREIHRLSPRRVNAMVSVDMGAVTETLFESELFGHIKGSFTDAHADRVGRFEAAAGSTLFLDEIGNIPYHLQAKLLTALQQRQIIRVGSNKPVPIDIRLICATNRNVWQMVEEGSFREDLLYRINTIHLEIPPLRERVDDIVPLAEIFISRKAQQYHRKVTGLTDAAAQLLQKQAWPGNIRELEHTIEKAVIIAEGTSIGTADLSFAESKKQAPQQPKATTLEDMECNMIRAAIDDCHGNLSLVAQQLGISRQTLYNKMKRYGI